MVLKDYLSAKYGSDSPGSDRFKSEVGEYHASHVADCQRKMWYRFNLGSTPSDPSPYFELGRVFERIYGAALASVYDDVNENQKPLEVVEDSWRVWQNLEMTIEIEDDISLVGESDWVVLRESAQEMVQQHGRPEEIEVLVGGQRRINWEDGHQNVLEPEESTVVEFVVETKTTNDVKDKRINGYSDGHFYQVYSYMWAFNCDGKIAYMERDDLSETIFDIDFTEEHRMDVELRVRQHHRNVQSEQVASASPNSRWDCYYCDYQSECQQAGGSKWN